MANEKTYQGWRNYETWATALWLSCDEGFDCEIHEYIATLDDTENCIVDLADYIQEFVEELAPDMSACLYMDLMNNALANVDFCEIAENYLCD